MNGHKLLEQIVVRISLDSDGRMGRGTGIVISNHEVATCYHVLAGEGEELQNSYYIKHDSWPKWVESEPLRDRSFPPPKDIAVLYYANCINIEVPGNIFAAWNLEIGCDEFLTRGYDRSIPMHDGAWTLDDKHSQIIDRTYKSGEPRLQLSTERDTLLQGRSGSPVWSKSLNAIVGMIDYHSGKESISKDRSLAIPIEELGINVSHHNKEVFGVLLKPPEIPNEFVARPNDLNEIKSYLIYSSSQSVGITGVTPHSQERNMLGLQGMGGIGKTVIAVALVQDKDVQQNFSDGIFWISLGRDPKLCMYQSYLYNDLGGKNDTFQIKDAHDGRNQLKEILKNKKCLIVLDDVWKLEHVEAFNALGMHCKILITTRNPGILVSLNAKEYPIDVLQIDDALKLLAKWSNQIVEDLPPEASYVALECGKLPLALAMIGAMIRGNGPDYWENVLQKLRNADLENIRPYFPLPDYHLYPNLLKAMEVSLDALEEDEWANCLRARERYYDFAVFPEDEYISPSVFQTFWRDSGLDKYQIQDIIGLFASRSLIQVRKEDGLLSLHDLQLDYVRRCSKDLSKLHDRLLKLYRKHYPNQWPMGPDDGYFSQHLAYHLMEAGRRNELKSIITKIEEPGGKFCIVGMGGFGGNIARKILENQTNSLTGRLMGYIRPNIYEEAKVIWLDSDYSDTEYQIVFKPFNSQKYPYFFIPHEVVAHDSVVRHIIMDRYGLDLKIPGFDRRVEYSKAMSEIFKYDNDVNKASLQEFQSENPLMSAVWNAIKPFMISKNEKNCEKISLQLCDGILLAFSLGGGTGGGLVNPLVDYIRHNEGDLPILALGLLTERGHDPKYSTEGKRSLAAISTLNDLLSKKIETGIDGIILVDNQILVEKFSRNYSAIDAYLSDAMKVLVGRGYYPMEKPRSIFYMREKFLEDTKTPSILIPCYYRQSGEDVSWEKMIEKALEEGQLFDCDITRSDRIYVFIRGFANRHKIIQTISCQTGLPLQKIELWRKLRDGTKNEILILLRNPYGGVKNAHKNEGTLEHRLYSTTEEATKYLNENYGTISYNDYREGLMNPIVKYFYRKNGFRDNLIDVSSRIEQGSKEIFIRDVSIFDLKKESH